LFFLEKKNIIFFLKETTGRTGRGFLGHPLGIRKKRMGYLAPAGLPT
jgi:hypothetical protein